MAEQEEMASGCARAGLCWILGKHSFTEHWNRGGRVTSLEVFKRHVDVVLGDMVAWQCWVNGWTL